MKKKIKIITHGNIWIDPNPTPVILCPECGSEKLISKTCRNIGHKNFLIIQLKRDSICKQCKDCGCVFEVDSDVTIEIRPVRIALIIFLISLIGVIVLLYFASGYGNNEDIPRGLALGILGAMLTTIVSFSWRLILL